MYALTILSYDSNISKNDQKTVWLIEMHQILIQALITLFKVTEATFEQRVVIALYFENLKRLPEDIQKTILGTMVVPRVEARKSSKASHFKKISEGLRRKFSENKKDFIVVDEESGLESEILPMDITIKDGTGKRIIAFIDFESPYHLMTRPDGQIFRKRRYQLKAELYKFNHPGVPVMRIDLVESKQRHEEYVEELYQKISSTVNEKG
jgi:hypothetical protein